MLIKVAAEHKMTVHQLYVKTAYLNAQIDCEIYVQQPEGFKETRRYNSCLEIKSMFIWFKTVAEPGTLF